ncbi:MAG: biotin synthase BioB, partial [Dehalococcoidia bacterium]
ILELLQSAFMVRERYFGKKVIIQLLINARSGLCTEDCAYCSQSAVSQASIEKYSLLDEDEIIKGASIAKSSQAKRYCVVTSGYAPSMKDLDSLCRVARKIKQEVGIELCNSLGHLSEEDARKLKEAGVDRYNHNLNTSERFYPNICSTHSYADRVQTLQNARKAGLKLCCGALFGMGESEDDIIDLALALREVGADSIPVNFLHPIPGTALEKQNDLTPLKCLSILCLMRFLNPRTEIRAAGGRELKLRSLQALALYPANSIFVSGYLTTGGQGPEEACQMIADMGFEVEQEAVQKAEV